MRAQETEYSKGRRTVYVLSEENCVCAPQALGPSGGPSFLARWLVRGRHIRHAQHTV